MEVIIALMSLVVTAVIVVAFCYGVFLLSSSRDKLRVAYQDYMLRKTGYPLKDRHFTNMREVLYAKRMLGASLVCLVLVVLGWMIYARSLPLS